eukprot:GFUD01031074.1.p1 GENE.GFUD01031074.1~~GFUD01031074.1.p1  ORF type:complete len:536 (+),score=108.08 GFUD01031074.1:85-1692(+)
MKLVRKIKGLASLETLAELFADIKIVCIDGVLLWNRSLLAASSPFLRVILSEDDSFIILDSFFVSTVKRCFSALCGKIERDKKVLFGEEEGCLLSLLMTIDKSDKMKEESEELKNTSQVQIAFKEELSDTEYNLDNGNFSGSDPCYEMEEDTVKKKKIKRKRNSESPQIKESINSNCFTKDPSPERHVDGVKTDVYFLSDETAASGPPYTCITCEYVSRSKRNVKVHFRRKHSKEKLYRCKTCDRKFYNSSEVVDHWKRMHGKAENFLKCVCDICGKMFPRQGELKVHELLHSGVEYPCKFCGKKFKTLEYLNGHEKLHTSERVACKTCGKTFTSQKGVENHEQRMHSEGAVGIECEMCGKILKTKDNLKLHIQLLHNEVEKKYSCDHCELFFRVPSQLKKHVQTVHEKSTQFSCPYCEQILSSKHKFKRHSQRKHGGIELPNKTDRSLCQPNALVKVRLCPAPEYIPITSKGFLPRSAANKQISDSFCLHTPQCYIRQPLPPPPPLPSITRQERRKQGDLVFDENEMLGYRKYL